MEQLNSSKEEEEERHNRLANVSKKNNLLHAYKFLRLQGEFLIYSSIFCIFTIAPFHLALEIFIKPGKIF